MAPSARASEKASEVAAEVRPSSVLMGRKKMVKPKPWTPPPTVRMRATSPIIRQP